MATQLGISAWQPLQFHRSVSKVGKNSYERWQRICLEACKQSGAAWLPELLPLEKPEEVAPKTQEVPAPTKPLEKTDALEIELLRSTLPQFDPNKDDVYDRDIDELGFSLYEGSKDNLGKHAMTRIEAGRKAVRMAKKITSKVFSIKSEAKAVKAQQSDQGITKRVLNRESEKLDPDKMSLEEKEKWLKDNGHW